MCLRGLEIKIALKIRKLFPFWKSILEHEFTCVKMNDGYKRYGFLFHKLSVQYIH